MNERSIEIKRTLTSFYLFYRQILIFSILLAFLAFSGGYILGYINPDTSDPVKLILYFIKRFSFRLPLYFFAGALGLTHSVQKNQYYYYRNQGSSIRFLVLMSWLFHCFIAVFLLILSYTVSHNG